MSKGMNSDEPKKRLIEAGLDLFAKYSFDGASTRMLAEKAQVNLASIKYYFGGKEGLYLAVADHIVEQVAGTLGPQLDKVRQDLKKPISREYGFLLICELVEFLITDFLDRTQSDKWLSIILREQLCPTDAFNILFEGFMKPLEDTLFGLARCLMGPDRTDQEVRLKVFTIMGEVHIFSISPGAIKRTLNWESYGPENLDAIREAIIDNLGKIFSMSMHGSYSMSGVGSGLESRCDVE